MPERIVLVPPVGDLARGFALARDLLGTAGSDRLWLVGHGATLRSGWPDWALRERRLDTRELGDYVIRSHVDETRRLRESITRWLDDVLEGAVDGLRPGQVFYSSAAARLFQPLIDAASFVSGLSELHPSATFHIVDADWAGLPLLSKAVAPTGGRVEAVGRTRGSTKWPLTILAHGAAALVATPLYPLREWMRARDSRRRVNATARGGGKPDIWFTMIGDWPRINRPLLDSIVLPELGRGTRLGILLVGGLGRGARKESDLRTRKGTELWMGLGELRESLERCTVDQAALPASSAELVRVLGRSMAASARALRRLAARSSVVDMPGLQIDLANHASGLARLVTIDTARANVAAAAARGVGRRHDLRGATIVQVSSSSADTTASDLVFQTLGARTVDVHHGSGADYWIGTPESMSSYACRFTHADAEVVGGLRGSSCLVGGMPVRLKPKPRTSANPANVLLLSNYVHRDLAQGTRYPLECFQNEVVAIGPKLRVLLDDAVVVRWRPHPADNDELVRKTLSQVTGVELSRGRRSIEEDIAWADVIVSTPSTTVLEALFADVPLFVHVPPEFKDGPNARAIAPERRVFRAEEAAHAIARAIEALRRGDRDATALELQARNALFGSSGMPEPFAEVLRSNGLLGGGDGLDVGM